MASASSSSFKNVKSSLLTDEENEIIFTNLGSRCQALATTTAELYIDVASDVKKIWQKQTFGVVCFVKDWNKRTYFVRFYDEKDKALICEYDLIKSRGIHITTEDTYIVITFDDKKIIFLDKSEAENFKKVITEKVNARKKKRNNIRARQNAGTEYSSIPSLGPGCASLESEKSTNLTRKSSDKKNKNKITISKPTSFNHVQHVGLDPDDGVDINRLDPEMRSLFEKIGINDDQDKETMQFIYDFIDKHGGLKTFAEEERNLRRKKQIQPPPPPRRPLPQGNNHNIPKLTPLARYKDRPLPPPPSNINKDVPPPPPPSIINKGIPSQPPPSNTNISTPPSPPPRNTNKSVHPLPPPRNANRRMYPPPPPRNTNRNIPPTPPTINTNRRAHPPPPPSNINKSIPPHTFPDRIDTSENAVPKPDEQHDYDNPSQEIPFQDSDRGATGGGDTPVKQQIMELFRQNPAEITDFLYSIIEKQGGIDFIKESLDRQTKQANPQQQHDHQDQQSESTLDQVSDDTFDVGHVVGEKSNINEVPGRVQTDNVAGRRTAGEVPGATTSPTLDYELSSSDLFDEDDEDDWDDFNDTVDQM